MRDGQFHPDSIRGGRPDLLASTRRLRWERILQTIRNPGPSLLDALLAGTRGSAGDLSRKGLKMRITADLRQGAWIVRTPWAWLLLVLVFAGRDMAAAEPKLTFQQPYGLAIEVFEARVGEQALETDREGYLIVKTREQADRYEYALRSAQGALVPSGIELGNVAGAESTGLQPGLTPLPEFLEKQAEQRSATDRPRPQVQVSPRPFDVETSFGTKQLRNRRARQFGWYVDEHGYSVVRVAPRYEYAVLGRDRKPVPTGIGVGTVDPEKVGLRPIAHRQQ